MYRQPAQWRDRINAIAQRFREKGAISPERAMTTRELGLPPRFEDAMKRRLGQTGIFVEVGGRYYLSEQRLVEFEQRRQSWGGYRGSSLVRRNMFALRITRMILGVLILSLVLVNFLYGGSLMVWAAIVVLIIVWISISLFQIFYLASSRGRVRPFEPSDNPNVTIDSNTSPATFVE
jgi:hypothetical protein